MKSYFSLTNEERKAELEALLQEYETEKAKNRQLNMARGVPAPNQLDLSMDMLTIPPETLIHSRKGTDVRNYG